MPNIVSNERAEKIKLIKQLFEVELKHNPSQKSDEWYGSQFDRWYDVKLPALRHLLDLKLMKYRN
jgi:hypothetical protein